MEGVPNYIVHFHENLLKKGKLPAVLAAPAANAWVAASRNPPLVHLAFKFTNKISHFLAL